MRVKAFDKLGGTPIVAEVSVVVVEDDDGVPILVAHKIADGCVVGCTAKDPEFNRTLHLLGINRLVIADSIDAGLSATPNKLPLLLGDDL